ncbi:MAG: hypothetical protein C0412_01435 [Flavobacterium sp.]|nr:hypothetical protein [Flavobacterium sp.]
MKEEIRTNWLENNRGKIFWIFQFLFWFTHWFVNAINDMIYLKTLEAWIDLTFRYVIPFFYTLLIRYIY